jgi:hypothetical protein
MVTSPSGVWQVAEAVAQFAVLTLVERPAAIALVADDEDARLRAVGQVLYDIPEGLQPTEKAVKDAVLAAARVLGWIEHERHDGEDR